jgi:hypothetical protein
MFLLRKVDDMSEIKMWQSGKKWYVADEHGDHEISGNTPKGVISEMTKQFPEFSGAVVIYDIERSSETKIVDVSTCPNCGKHVSYVRCRKSNGRVGVVVLHEGEERPSDAVDANDISKEYMIWLLDLCHKEIQTGKTKQVQKPEATKKKSKKPIVDLELEVVAAASPVARNLPIVDIGGTKRNRFVIIKRIVDAMRPTCNEELLTRARSEMLNAGKNFESFIDSASNFAELYDIS